jgi:hypothetical protein
MPANWDPSQNLNGTRVEWPRGELTDDKGSTFPQAGWTPKWLEAWVVQDGSHASQRTVQTANWAPGHWTADQSSRENGVFQPGLALGIALLAYHDGTKDTHKWWFELVDLY